MLKALTRLTRKVEIYSVDIEVELDHDVPRRRLQIIPEVVEASSEDQACERALQIELARDHYPKRVGGPRVVALRRLEFREGW